MADEKSLGQTDARDELTAGGFSPSMAGRMVEYWYDCGRAYQKAHPNAGYLQLRNGDGDIMTRARIARFVTYSRNHPEMRRKMREQKRSRGPVGKFWKPKAQQKRLARYDRNTAWDRRARLKESDPMNLPER